MNNKQKQYRYEIVYNTLKKSILDSTYLYGTLLPSEKKITQLFSVDRTTARKGLDLLVKNGFVKKEAGVGTRVIFSNVQTMPTLEIESQPITPQNTIGFLVMKYGIYSNKSEQPYYSDLFFELELQCKSRGFQAIYCTIDQESDFTDVITRNNFIGVVFVSSIPDQYIQQASTKRIPMAIINRFSEYGTCVMCDHSKGAKMAIRYLYSMGHKRIAIIRGAEGFISDEDKMAGCLSAAFEGNMNLEQQLIVRGNWTFLSGYEGANRIFSRKDFPSAVFCFNDIMALGAIKALREMGFIIGKDISVMGFDNMRQLHFSEPDLTTIDCNVVHVAKFAIDHVLSVARGEEELPVLVQVPVKLIESKTVCKI